MIPQEYISVATVSIDLMAIIDIRIASACASGRLTPKAEAFASECAKLDPHVEQQLAAEGMEGEHLLNLIPND
jgi:hypothetical protein